MPEYLSPGVYIEEIETGAMPIEGVGTSTAGFVGPTERGPVEPQLVTSFADYQRTFGGVTTASFQGSDTPRKSYLAYAVDGFFRNGGSRVFVGRVTAGEAETATATIGDVTVRANGPGTWGTNVQVEVAASDIEDRFTVFVRYWRDGIPDDDSVEPTVEERYDDLDATEGTPDYYAKSVNNASSLVEIDENALGALPVGTTALEAGADGELGVDDFEGVEDDVVPTPSGGERIRRTGLKGFTQVDEIAIVCIPDEAKISGLRGLLRGHCRETEDRFAILQTDQGVNPDTLSTDGLPNDAVSERGLAALYYPWVKVLDPFTNVETLVPPGGHVAGVYARTDTNRGVHKAPANEQLQGVQGLEHEIRRVDQNGLNPKGINCIRAFRGRGIRIWGARTTSPKTIWRYVNVRRLFLFLEESLDEGTQWAVFEPNDEPLWARVRQSVTDFLTGVWRDGALQGTTPEEAFYVKCDRTTMTQDDIDKGRLIIEVGVAPVKPAEFVIFRITQWTAGAEGA